MDHGRRPRCRGRRSVPAGYRWDDGEERRAQIEESEEPRRLGFSWSDPDGDGDETRVTFELEHLAALSDAGLVESDRVGRETRYRLTPGALEDAVGWMERVGGQWDDRLAALRRHLGG